jgi:hypothetical protein
MMFDLINGDGTFSPMLAVIAIIALVELVKKSEEHARQRRIDEAEALGEADVMLLLRMSEVKHDDDCEPNGRSLRECLTSKNVGP